MIKHWKTSLCGLALFGAALFHMHFSPLPGGAVWQDHVRYWGHDYMILVAGLACLFAKDHDK